MNLLTKYYRANIIATILVVVLSSICYYFMIHFILIEQLDNALKVEQQEVMDFVKVNNTLPEPSSYKDQQVNFKNAAGKKQQTFSNVKIFNKEENQVVPTRLLSFVIDLRGKLYEVEVSKSREETDELIKLIVFITLCIVLLLLLIVFLVNRFLLRRLWRPFYATLAQLRELNFSGKMKPKLQQSEITEFNELNKAVGIMINQLSQEYETLKVFTENASHEMQTPLAIINSKLDVLVQDENISEYQMGHLQSIYDALDRLSKLNQSLLLLVKIGNKQFIETETIRLDLLLKEKLSQFEEMIGNNKLTLDIEMQEVSIHCNKQLAEILLNNLLSNAIRYNKDAGLISCQLTNQQLIISNNSWMPALDAHKVFQRFYRPAQTTQEGNGLGLSIIKQICENNGFGIEYGYEDEAHAFRITFRKNSQLLPYYSFTTELPVRFTT